MSSIGVAVVFGLGFTKFVSVFLWVVFVDCIGVGLVIGSLLWFVSNKYLKEQYHAHSVDQNVELAYAFDVHCNAFFPLLIILHVLQLFFVKRGCGVGGGGLRGGDPLPLLITTSIHPRPVLSGAAAVVHIGGLCRHPVAHCY